MGPTKICGGDGNNLIQGGSGNDFVGIHYTVTGDNVVVDLNGNNNLTVRGSGADSITDGDGDSRLDVRGDGQDTVVCGGGFDTAYANAIDNVAADCERISRQ